MEKEKLLTGLREWRTIAHHEKFHSLEKTLKITEEDLQDNLLVMVSGEFNAGKSTFINALLGEKFLTTDITPATAVITKLTYGEEKRVIVHYQNGTTAAFEPGWLEQLTAERSGDGESVRRRMSYVEYQLPLELLKTYTIIDSPGLTALHEHHTRVTESFMERNEMGIWLFHAMSVGTASEMGWLRWMHDLEVPVLGVVNAIDLLDEEEDINSFLEFNERRMYPLIKKLYGISAQDILQGKLDDDAQLLEWGNARAIDEVFNEISPVNMRKMEGFYRKLQKPLKQYLNYVKEKKASFAFLEDEEKNWAFQVRHFPSFIEQADKVQLLEAKLVNFEEDWRSFHKERGMDKDFASQVVIKLGSPQDLTGLWNNKLKSEISVHRRAEESLLQKRTRLMGEQRELDNRWVAINNSLFKLKKKSKFSKQEVLLNTEIEKWNFQIEKLNENSRKLKRSINQFNTAVRKRIEQNISTCRTAYTAEMAALLEIQSNIQEEFGTIHINEMADFQDHLKYHNTFCNEVSSSFQAQRLMISQLESYKKAMETIEEARSIYAETDYLKLAEQLAAFYSFNVQEMVVAPLSFETVSETAFKPSDYLKLPIFTKQSSREIMDNRSAIAKWRTAAAGSVLLLLSYPVLSIIDWESNLNGAVKTAEEIYGEFREPEIEWDMDDSENGAITMSAEVVPQANPATQEEMPDFRADETAINSFIHNFRSAYLLDLNQATVATLPNYIDMETDIYKELASYVGSLDGKGLSYEFHSTEVQMVEELEMNRYSVITNETYTIASVEGEASYNERIKEYVVSAVADNSFLIEDITTLEETSEALGYITEEEVSEETEIAAETAENTVDLVTHSEVGQMMNNFYLEFEMAFNGSGFESISHYFAESGPEYAATASYISNAIEKGMWMRNHEIRIDSVEVYDSAHYLATIYVRDAYQYQDGTGDQKEISADYLVKVTEEGFLEIEKILDLEILSETEI